MNLFGFYNSIAGQLGSCSTDASRRSVSTQPRVRNTEIVGDVAGVAMR